MCFINYLATNIMKIKEKKFKKRLLYYVRIIQFKNLTLKLANFLLLKRNFLREKNKH